MKMNHIIIIFIIIAISLATMKYFNFFSDKKITVWIYNPIIKNSNKWKGVYSRRSIQDTIGLVKLCIHSAKFNLGKNYDIKVFNQDDLEDIIPESLYKLDQCNTKEIMETYMKYSILYKYGGIWIPNSTITLNPLSLNMDEYEQGRLLLFGLNHENYQTEPRYNDLIVATDKETTIVNNILHLLDKSLITFNYDNIFNNYVNTYINERPGDLYFSHLILQYDMVDESIEKRDMTTTFNNRLINYDNYSFYYIPTHDFEKYPAYTFMLKLSPQEILTSNTFIGELFKYSVKKEKKLVYSAVLNQ